MTQVECALVNVLEEIYTLALNMFFNALAVHANQLLEKALILRNISRIFLLVWRHNKLLCLKHTGRAASSGTELDWNDQQNSATSRGNPRVSRLVGRSGRDAKTKFNTGMDYTVFCCVQYVSGYTVMVFLLSDHFPCCRSARADMFAVRERPSSRRHGNIHDQLPASHTDHTGAVRVHWPETGDAASSGAMLKPHWSLMLFNVFTKFL